MATEKRLIDANELKKQKTILWDEAMGFCDCVLMDDIDDAPTVDAVEVDAISEWLYQIAMNNVGSPSLLSAACIEIISRLGGLVTFARERNDKRDG